MNKEVENVFQTCRACLSVSQNISPISEVVPQFNISALKMFNYFLFEIDEDDNLPKTICLSCLKHLHEAYMFFHSFKKSQEILSKSHNNESEENRTMTFNDSEPITHYKVESETNNIYDEDSRDSVSDKEDEDTENFIIKYEENSKNHETCDSDDEDYLIEQSIKLTQQSKLLNKFDNGHIDNDPEVNLTESEDSNILLTCPICSKIFEGFPVLRSHLLEHDEEIVCKICSLHFNDTDLYIKHYQMKHRYQCNICRKSFQRKENYNKHTIAHSNVSPEFSCPFENCTKKFAVKQSLQNHLITIHSEKRNFLCNICGAAFKNYDNLRYHIKKHTGPSHLCTYCGQRFMQAGHLKYHMWRHNGLKPHKCPNCHKCFVARKVLVKHMERSCSRSRKRSRFESINI